MCVHTKGKNEDRLLVVGAIRSGKWSATDDLEATRTRSLTRARSARKKKEKKKSNEIENECAPVSKRVEPMDFLLWAR